MPRTNNDLEHLFGRLRHQERRITGRKVATPGLIVRGSVRVLSALILPPVVEASRRCDVGWDTGVEEGSDLVIRPQEVAATLAGLDLEHRRPQEDGYLAKGDARLVVEGPDVGPMSNLLAGFAKSENNYLG